MAATIRTRSTAMISTAMLLITAATLLAVASASASAGGVSCGDVVSALAPCGGFLTGAGPAVPPVACCQGAQSLRRLATTADARRAVCRCMVQSAPSFGVVPDRARMLPKRCNIAVELPALGGVTDCNKIS